MFLGGSTLMVQSFDPSGAAVKDEPRALVEGVGSYSASRTGVVAYRPEETERMRRLAWLDRQGRRLGASEPHRGLNDISLSPDGKQVAAILEVTGGNNLWLIDPARNAKSRFTFHRDKRQASPVWSPDGSFVVFSSSREEHEGLYLRASTGTSSEELLATAPPRHGRFATSWSRDGRFLVYHQQSAKDSHSYDIWILPMKGDRQPIPVLTTNFSERQGQLSPDSRWLAYTSDESGERQVYVLSFTLGATRTSPVPEGKWPVSTNGGHSPKWSHDGKELYYIGEDRRLYVVDVKPGRNFESEVPRPLFELSTWTASANFVYRYDISSDGRVSYR
jgi:eukaryotic-like serine/threonine-protein kinase